MERARLRLTERDIVAALRAVLPSEAVIADPESMRPFECDGLSAYRQLPRVVVLPSTPEEVQTVLKLCYERRVPVVSRGAGTSLCGGALPDRNGVLLSLSRLNRILDVDPDNRTAVVQPGVRNLAISEAVAPHGLYYAPDPSSQIACSIGGNVAENSGGVHCLKYGLTVHNVLRVKLLTIDGEWLDIGSQALDAPGYDLLALINGSEGMLGVIMEITVRLLPIPTTAQVAMAAFASVEDAGRAVADIIASGIVPAGLEMMDRLAIRAAEDFVHAGYPTDCDAILICELDGIADEVADQLNRVRAVLHQHRAVAVRIAADESERKVLWAGRKAAFPAVGRLAPDYYCVDGTIPRRQLAFVLRRIAELSEQYGLPVANVFHAGDGNLHPLIMYDANQPGELAKAERFGADILELSVNVGGTITGEHGVGVEKLDQMCVQFGKLELQMFHAIKHVFDGYGLLNPGKAVPTLSRCAELGGMHVHNGQLPHPELPRF